MNHTKKEMLSKCETINDYIKRSSCWEIQNGETNEWMTHPQKRDILPKNEFLRRHSDYIEKIQKDTIQKFSFGYTYPDGMGSVVGKVWYSYVEAYKYDPRSLLKWKQRQNKEYKNKPYPARNFEHRGTLEEYCGTNNPFI